MDFVSLKLSSGCSKQIVTSATLKWKWMHEFCHRVKNCVNISRPWVRVAASHYGVIHKHYAADVSSAKIFKPFLHAVYIPEFAIYTMSDINSKMYFIFFSLSTLQHFPISFYSREELKNTAKLHKIICSFIMSEALIK